MRLNMVVCACLAVTAAALRPSLVSALRAPLSGRALRARRLVAQEQGLPAGWSAGFDETSGSTYYVNDQTGESQWELPLQQGGPASQEEQGAYAQQGGYEPAQELPSGWRTAFDEGSQATYYVNELTGETQWEAPSPQPSAAQPDAQQAASPRRTAQAVRWHMAAASGWGPRDLQKPTRPWVSRKQCLVYVGADGAANLVSCGQYLPTLWRERGGEWVALYKDDGLVLAEGDEVSVDSNDPEGTVFISRQMQGADFEVLTRWFPGS